MFIPLTCTKPRCPTTEFLLQDNPSRFVLFPIQHHSIWNMYKKHEVRPQLALFSFPPFFPLGNSLP